MKRMRRVAIVVGIGAVVGTAGAAVAISDPGVNTEDSLEAHSVQYFGVVQGLNGSSTSAISKTEAAADPAKLGTLAQGLSARVLTDEGAANLDMGTLWPADDPEWIISCNEQGSTKPSLQRTSLTDGHVETIVTGLLWCDPAHTTAWGSVIFGEEAGRRSHMYEILNPGAVTGATINRITGATSVPNQIAQRDALGVVSFEGITTLPSGVTYYGDELSPSEGEPGGSYYKFTPTHPWTGGGTIPSLNESPLADGTVSGLRVSDDSNYGQGMNSGDGMWLPLEAGRLRPQARELDLTGFYRPEDLSLDEAALRAGEVRWCGNNTGREEAHYYGETVCITDGTATEALAGTSIPEVQTLIPGSPALNSPDNIAYQPTRGNWIIHEDGSTTFEAPHNNDLWSCLDDGQDANLQSDGCLRIATLNDPTAEWTGGFFDAGGEHFYVSVQHNVTGRGVLLDITGWK